MEYTFKVMADTLLRSTNWEKCEYKQGDLITVNSFADYRNFLNYARRWIIIEVKMKEEILDIVDSVVDTATDVINTVDTLVDDSIETINTLVDTTKDAVNNIVTDIKNVSSKKSKKNK